MNNSICSDPDYLTADILTEFSSIIVDMCVRPVRIKFIQLLYHMSLENRWDVTRTGIQDTRLILYNTR